MATYLYCIHAEAVSMPAALVGVDGAPVRAVAVAELEAWVSDVYDVPVGASVERIRAHDAVCSAALQVNETPLPIRFGQTFASDAALQEAIAAKAPQLSRRLRRVAGCVELRVVVRAQAIGSSVSGADVATDENAFGVDRPGTAFLRRLAQEGRADLARDVWCEEARFELRSAARELIVDHQPCEAARGVSYFAVLVRRGDVDAVRGLAGRVSASRRGEMVVMGPFAPYSFAGDA